MSIDVVPDDWSHVDQWWGSYVETRSIVRPTPEIQVLETEALTPAWEDLDSWWLEQTKSAPIARSATSLNTLHKTWLSDTWEELDPWWDDYAETGQETAVELAALLNEANELWADSEAPFDTDPLAGDVTRDRYERGPLQPSIEPEWSRWLAQLLRPSSALISELFDVTVDRPPETVTREDRLAKTDDEAFRRPDVVVVHNERGISIEVKLGDENYRKTPETAQLVERNYDVPEWTHVLLLPESQSGSLETIVDPPVEPDGNGRLQVTWDEPGPIDVLYWRDVTAAIRTLLGRGDIVDDHWAANAYLFCAVAEQQLMNFQPQPVVERLAEPTNVVDAIQPIRMANTLEEQLTYLRERLDS